MADEVHLNTAELFILFQENPESKKKMIYGKKPLSFLVFLSAFMKSSHISGFHFAEAANSVGQACWHKVLLGKHD